MRWVLLVAFLVCGVLAEASMPEFPPSLEINYNTIAYQIPESQEYPPRIRSYKLLYDRDYGGARFEYKDENGVDVILVKNYRQHYEVRIESLNGTDLCEYSYLGQRFPLPSFPSKVSNNGIKVDGDQRLIGYSVQNYRQYFDIYFEEVTKLPLRVDEYWITGENAATPVFSTVYSHISRETLSPWLFDVLYWKDSGRCSRNSKGWPYKHIFGPFVKVYLVFSIQTFAKLLFLFSLILRHVHIELCIQPVL